MFELFGRKHKDPAGDVSVEVLTMENKLLFLGRIESMDEKTIVLREAEGKQVPPSIFNTLVKVRRVSTASEVSVFYGKISGNTPYWWRLDRLEEKRVQENRAYYRQWINSSALVRRAVDLEPEAERPCQVLDISMGGALIRCSEKFRVGEYLLLTQTKILKEAPFNLTCFVRRIARDEDGYQLYGCEFGSIPVAEERRLSKALFTAQQQEIRQKRGRNR